MIFASTQTDLCRIEAGIRRHALRDEHPSHSHHTGHHRRSLLVRSASAPDRYQLPTSQHDRFAAVHDASLGLSRRAIGRVQHRSAFQCGLACSSPDLDSLKPDHLGTVLLLWQIMGHKTMHCDSLVDRSHDGWGRSSFDSCLEGSTQ